MLKIFNQSHEVVGYIKKYRDCKIESVLSTAEKTLSFTYLGKSRKLTMSIIFRPQMLSM